MIIEYMQCEPFTFDKYQSVEGKFGVYLTAKTI